jgi:hypothetical protein
MGVLDWNPLPLYLKLKFEPWEHPKFLELGRFAQVHAILESD